MFGVFLGFASIGFRKVRAQLLILSGKSVKFVTSPRGRGIFSGSIFNGAKQLRATTTNHGPCPTSPTSGGGVHEKKNESEKTKSTEDQVGSPDLELSSRGSTCESPVTRIATQLSALQFEDFVYWVLFRASAFLQQNSGDPATRIHLEG